MPSAKSATVLSVTLAPSGREKGGGGEIPNNKTNRLAAVIHCQRKEERKKERQEEQYRSTNPARALIKVASAKGGGVGVGGGSDNGVRVN